MNILHITELYDYGGAAKVAKDLQRCLLKEGNTSYIVSGYNIKESLNIEEHNIVLFQNSEFNSIHAGLKSIYEKYNIINFYVLFKILYLIKKYKIDLIHMHAMQGGFIGIREVGILSQKYPVVWTLHDTWTFTGGCMHFENCYNWKNNACLNCSKNDLYDFINPNRALMKKKNNFCNKKITFVSPSQWIKNNAMDSIIGKEKNVLINNGVDINIFRPLNKTEIRRKLNIPQTKFYIGFVSADVSNKYKGYRALIDAIQKIQNQEEYTLLIVGNGYKQNFGKCKVKYFGYISDENKLNEIYNAVDFFIIPSMEDNFPCVALEVMAAGVPIVTFPTGGLVEQVSEDVGWVTKYKKAENIANIINDITKHSEDIIVKGKNARKKCEKFYSIDRMYKKYIKIYKQTILRKGDKRK